MKNTEVLMLIFCVLFKGALTELIPEESCDVEDEAMTQWYTHVFQCVKTNQNATQNIAELKENLRMLEENVKKTHTKLEDLEQKLDQMLKLQQTSGEITVQRREDGSENFYRDWEDYKQGFGDANGEFFIGLDKLHKLTNRRRYGLLIVMEDWENERRYASYSRFVVGSESEKYVLKSLGNFTGTAGDSLSAHLGQKFSTKDQDNDQSSNSCSVTYMGAWWYEKCHDSNLNGPYRKGKLNTDEKGQGVGWSHYRGSYDSLKFVEMSLVPSTI